MHKYIFSSGKRKTSIARIALKEGIGNIIINNKDMKIKNKKIPTIIERTLALVNMNDKVDLKITVKGGGTTGQAEAIRHGISKALIILDKENSNNENSFKKKA